MWLVSCKRQGMLTNGLAPDPKCKLITSSFLHFTFIRLSHLYQECHVYCIVVISNGGIIMVEGGSSILECGCGDRGWVSSYSFCLFSCAFVFCCLMFSVPLFRWLEHDGFCVCFFVLFCFCFLSLVLLTRSHQCREIVVPVA